MSTLKVNNVTDLGDDAVITDGALVGAGKILQVVQTVKTDIFSTSSTTPTEIPGASVTITPSSSDSKVLVSFSGAFHSNGNNFCAVQLLRGATVVGGGTAVGSRLSAIGRSGQQDTNNGSEHLEGQFLDSPATTSATTYSLKVFTNVVAGVFIGRSSIDGDNALAGSTRTPLTITAMEVAG